jgi:hypothetical protein
MTMESQLEGMFFFGDGDVMVMMVVVPKRRIRMLGFCA